MSLACLVTLVIATRLNFKKRFQSLNRLEKVNGVWRHCNCKSYCYEKQCAHQLAAMAVDSQLDLSLKLKELPKNKPGGVAI